MTTVMLYIVLILIAVLSGRSLLRECRKSRRIREDGQRLQIAKLIRRTDQSPLQITEGKSIRGGQDIHPAAPRPKGKPGGHG